MNRDVLLKTFDFIDEDTFLSLRRHSPTNVSVWSSALGWVRN